MRTILLLILVSSSGLLFSQPDYAPADSGKAEFRLQNAADVPDYTRAYQILSAQVKADPTNAELHYFLGYTIDRMNSNDASGMNRLRTYLTIEASHELEEVIRLEPLYTGELIVLDPYSKLGSIWGSLAVSFLEKNQIDSLNWALKEAKRRGGFIEPMLDYSRQMLNSCDQNAILLSAGDNTFFCSLYLQTIEKFRTDVLVLDANLLGTGWYAKMLRKSGKIKYKNTDVYIDSTPFLKWEGEWIDIINPDKKEELVRWNLRPTYFGSYILRGDIVLLDIIKTNMFSRPIYFISGSDSSYNLHLDEYLENDGIVDRLSHMGREYPDISSNFSKYSVDHLDLSRLKNSPDAVYMLNFFRWNFLERAYALDAEGKKDKAIELIELMNQKFTKENLPFVSDEIEDKFNGFVKMLVD